MFPGQLSLTMGLKRSPIQEDFEIACLWGASYIFVSGELSRPLADGQSPATQTASKEDFTQGQENCLCFIHCTFEWDSCFWWCQRKPGSTLFVGLSCSMFWLFLHDACFLACSICRSNCWQFTWTWMLLIYWLGASTLILLQFQLTVYFSKGRKYVRQHAAILWLQTCSSIGCERIPEAIWQVKNTGQPSTSGVFMVVDMCRVKGTQRALFASVDQ